MTVARLYDNEFGQLHEGTNPERSSDDGTAYGLDLAHPPRSSATITNAIAEPSLGRPPAVVTCRARASSAWCAISERVDPMNFVPAWPLSCRQASERRGDRRPRRRSSSAPPAVQRHTIGLLCAALLASTTGYAAVPRRRSAAAEVRDASLVADAHATSVTSPTCSTSCPFSSLRVATGLVLRSAEPCPVFCPGIFRTDRGSTTRNAARYLRITGEDS
jgi:hypothetical protein